MAIHTESDYLSSGDLARELGVSIKTVRRWEKKGKITAVRTIGGHRRFLRSDVLSAVKRRTRPTLRTEVLKSAPKVAVPMVIEEIPAEELTSPEPFDEQIVELPIPSDSDAYGKYDPTLEPARKSGNKIVSKAMIFAGALIIISALIKFPPSMLTSTENTWFAGTKLPRIGTNKAITAIDAESYNPFSEVLAYTTSINDLFLNVAIPAFFENSVDIEGDIAVRGDASIAQSIIVGGSGTFDGVLTTESVFEANGGTITSTADTFSLLDDTLISLTIGGAATSIAVGAGDGTFTVNSAQTNVDSLLVNGTLSFEGTAIDGNQTTLSVTNPTADRIITLPDASGEVSLFGQTVTSAEILDGSILASDLSTTNDATNDYALTYDSDSGGFTWVVLPASEAAENYWSVSGNLTYLTDTADDVTIGGSTSIGKLGIVGDTDEIQLVARGQAGQTSNLFEVQTSAGSSLFSVANSGNTIISGDLAVNGGDITTTQTTVNLINSTATTLNIGGAATSLSLGAVSGTTTVNNALSVLDNIDISGAAQIDGVLTLGTDGADGSLVLFNDLVAGDHTVTFNVSASQEDADITYTLPINDGDTNQVLVTDGSGLLTWASISGVGAVDILGTPTAGQAVYWHDNNTLASEDALALSRGGTGASLTDPGADRILFWDDGADTTAFLEVSGGLSLSGTTLSHADTSAQADSTNAGATVIQSIGLDEYGHLDSLTTVDLSSLFDNYNYWTIAGDDAHTRPISSTETLTIAGGTNGIDTDVSDSANTITLNLDTTEIDDVTFGSGTGFTWTFDAGATNPTVAFADDTLTLNAGVINLNGDLAGIGGITADGTISFSPSATSGITFALDADSLFTLTGVQAGVGNLTTLCLDDSDNLTTCSVGTGGVSTAGGTPGTIAKFTASGTIGDSLITESGTTLSLTTATTLNSTSLTGINLGAATIDFNGLGVLQYADASNFTIQDDGGNDILALTGATNELSFGNATDNNTFTFLGTGVVTFSGNLNANGGLDVDDTFVIADGGNFTTTGTAAFRNAAGLTIGLDQTTPTNNVAGVLSLISGGDNAFSTTLTAGTQTEDIDYTLPTFVPDNDDYVLTTTSGGVLEWKTVTGIPGSGDITSVGGVTSGAAFATGSNQGTSLFFYDAEGEGELTLADLDGPQTWTLPNASGVICTSSGNCDGGEGGSKWTDSGTTVYLTDTSDELVIGGTTPLSGAKTSVDGDADQIQLLVQGHSSQSVNIIEVETEAEANLFTLDNSGNVVVAGDLTITGNDILGSGGTVLTFVGTNTTVAGDLAISGGNITTAVTFDSTTAVTGTFTANGDVDLGNAVSDTISLVGSLDSNINFLDADATSYTIAGADAATATGTAGNLTMRAGAGGATSGGGGNLILSAGTVTSGTAGYVALETNGSERLRFAADGTFLFEKGSNDLTISVTAPSGGSRTATIPALTADDDFVFEDLAQTLTNKSLTSPTITGTPTASGATWADLGSVTTIDINGGSIDGTTVGSANRSSGAFTTLAADSTVTLENVGAGNGNALCLDASDNLVTCTVGSGGISGSGTAGQIAFFDSGSNITSEASGFGWDSTDDLFTVTSDNTTGTTFALTSSSLTTGEVLDITTASSPTAGGTQSLVDLNFTNSPSSVANTLNGLDVSLSDATNLSNHLYGVRLAVDNSGNTSAGTHSIYGGYFTATGKAAGTTTAIGLYSSASGADFNYAAIFENGNVGIGTTGPDAKLDILTTDDEKLRLTEADGTVYTSFSVDNSGNLTIDGTGTYTAIADDLSVLGGDLTLGQDGTDGSLTLYNDAAVGGDWNVVFAPSASQTESTSYTLPISLPGSDNYVLTSTTGGVLEWQSTSGIGGVTGSGTENFIPRWDSSGTNLVDAGLSDNGSTITLSANRGLTLASGTGAISQTYTGTTTDAISVSANSLTIGNALDITAASSPTAGGTQSLVDFNFTNSPSSVANTLNGLDVSLSDATNLSNGLYGVRLAVDNSSNTSAGTHSIYGGHFTATGKTAGTTTAIGLYSSASGADFNYAAIFENGNVGIGTDAPEVVLDIVGDVQTTTDYHIGAIGLTDTGSAITSGAFLIGVFDEFDNADSANLQAVLNELDAAITTAEGSGVTGITAGTGISGSATTGDITLAFASDELTDLDWGTGTGFTWTFDAGATDPTIAFASDTITITAAAIDLTGDLDISGILTSGTADAFQVDADGNLTTSGTLSAAVSDTLNGVSINTGAVSDVTTLSQTGVHTIAPTTTGTFLDFQLETEWTAGTLINADWASSTNQSAAGMTVLGVDFSNLTAAANQTLYGLHINDPATDTGSVAGNQYAIYQQGTNWDYGAYFEDEIYTGSGIHLPNAVPGTTTNRLYSDGDALYYNGSPVSTSMWTDGGSYLYPTDGEVLGDNASAGANKIAGIYLDDDAPLAFGSDNDWSVLYDETTDDRLEVTTSGTSGLLMSTAKVTGTAFDLQANAITTGTGFDLSLDALTSGSGMVIEAGGSTRTISGDLLKINAGSGLSVSGNFLTIQNNGTNLFSVKSTKITSALPHEFTAPGDVNIAYDLVLTNQSSNNIKSFGPLKITSGETFENNNLTLSTYGAGYLNVEAAGGSLFTRDGGAVATMNRLTSDGTLMAFQRDGVEVANISVTTGAVSYNPFTGSHYAWTDEVIEKGKVVRMTGINEYYHDNPDSEIIYGITESTYANDPAVLGSYLGILESTEEHATDNPYLVMAAGNGEMWVADNGEDIVPGDFLISSDIKGYAQKDTGVYPVSYVIARAGERVEWDDVNESVDGTKHKMISVFYEFYARVNTNPSIAGAAYGDTSLALNGIKQNDLGSKILQIDEVSANTLTVFGDAVLGDTTITGELAVGTLTIDGFANSIDAIGTLKLQPMALGNVELVGGSIVFTTNGNVEIKEGVILGNSNFRSTETLLPGTTTIRVNRRWDRTPVSITANASFDTYVWVENITQSGFTLKAKNTSAKEEKIYWTAIW